jgi:hypothetical protein
LGLVLPAVTALQFDLHGVPPVTVIAKQQVEKTAVRLCQALVGCGLDVRQIRVDGGSAK